MAKTVKVTDLTKLEGDPDPRKADVSNIPMFLRMHARAPWQAGVVEFVARCSERSPVARALVVGILLASGLSAAAVAHVVLAGAVPGWLAAGLSLILIFVPFGMYWAVGRMKS